MYAQCTAITIFGKGGIMNKKISFVLAAALMVELFAMAAPTQAQYVYLPNVVGMSGADAGSVIRSAGLTISWTYQYSVSVAEGLIISQDPPGGAMVPEGSDVHLFLSLGPQPVEVPDVVGMSETDASSELNSAGLTISWTSQYSGTVAEGLVISQDPAGGTTVPEGSVVALVMSLGPKPVKVPDVVGMSDDEAESAIHSAGLYVSITLQHSDTVAKGLVISQNPAGGTWIPEGSDVNFVISLGLRQPPVGPPVKPDAGCLAAHWKLDDGSGTTAIDSSGNGFDMTLYNNTWEDGVLEGAAHFHGMGYGEVSDVNYKDNVITLCAWVWHDVFIVNKIERYITAGQSTAAICKEYDGRLVFYVDTDDNLRHLLAEDVLTEGQWHHVAGIWDGLTQHLYMDGEEIADQQPEPVGVLGGISDVTLSSETGPFNGMLDDVRIYNCALSINEIRYLAGF